MTSEPDGNLWTATSRETAEAPPLRASVEVDLAVVGGGFTGLSAALEAAGQGASVCVLEARRVGYGGSGRNVGLVNAGLWLPPDAILAELGEAEGERLIAALSEAPGRVFDLVERHGIDCEPVRQGTLHCAHSPAGLSDLQERFLQGNRMGAPVRLLDAEETRRRTGTSAFFGALFDPRAGTIQPLSYARGLARAAREAGARVHGETPVRSLSREGGVWRLDAGGASVRARAVLIATNAYHLGIEGPFRPRFVPVGFSQFATAPLGDAERAGILEGGEGCWDTAVVLSSFRTDRAGRLILGAIGEREGPGGRVHGAWARRKLARMFPRLRSAAFEHAWSGTIAMTSDHVPKIVEFGPSALACFGYSGRGIAPGTVFGAAAARALLTGEREGLPLTPIDRHSERFVRPRAAYYELGATLTHAVQASPLPMGRA